MVRAAVGTEREARRPTPPKLGFLRERHIPGSATLWLVVGVMVVAFVLRGLTAQSDAVTTDETNWMARSYLFQLAVTTGDFDSASALSTAMRPDPEATMPGVTTMWVGAAAKSLWSAGHHGGADGDVMNPGFLTHRSGFDLAQTFMALATALVIGVLTGLTAVWAGRVVAGVAGLLVATEPFFVAHGAVLHTDELVALFGTAALVATALALGVPRRTAWTGRWWAGSLAGALWAGALLTKLSALLFLPGAALLGLWALGAAALEQRRHGDTSLAAALMPVVRTAAWWVATAVVVTFALYPALWVAPLAEYHAIRRSVSMASEGHQQYFLGETTATPGPAFYAVLLPLRMTPWFLAGALVTTVAAWRRATRPMALAVVCMGVPVLVLLSLASKQLDRYGLSVLAPLALAVGLVVDAGALAAAVRWPGCRRALAVAAGAAAAAVTAYSLTVVPWGLAFYNPALGGGDRAERSVLVGWWEGVEQAGDIIAERERGHCDEVGVSGPWVPIDYPCGSVGEGSRTATYVVVYISQWQRAPGAVARSVVGRSLVDTVEIRGITYVKVYGPRHATRDTHNP